MKISSILVGIAAVASAFYVSGCASVVRGSSERITIQSEPSGAEVRLSDGHTGVTPFETEVKRKDTIMVTVTKPGFKEYTTALIASIDGASLGLGTAANFLTLPIINDVVDYKTGANFSHKPNPLLVRLIALEPSAPSAAPAVTTAPAPVATPTPIASVAGTTPAVATPVVAAAPSAPPVAAPAKPAAAPAGQPAATETPGT